MDDSTQEMAAYHVAREILESIDRPRAIHPPGVVAILEEHGWVWCGLCGVVTEGEPCSQRAGHEGDHTPLSTSGEVGP